jgi:hypothetical protein
MQLCIRPMNLPRTVSLTMNCLRKPSLNCRECLQLGVDLLDASRINPYDAPLAFDLAAQAARDLAFACAFVGNGEQRTPVVGRSVLQLAHVGVAVCEPAFMLDRPMGHFTRQDGQVLGAVAAK